MSNASSNQQNNGKNPSNYTNINNSQTSPQTSKRNTTLQKKNTGYNNENNSQNSGEHKWINPDKRTSLEIYTQMNAQKNGYYIPKSDQSQSINTFSNLPYSQKKYLNDATPRNKALEMARIHRQKNGQNKINQVNVKQSVYSFENNKQSLPKKLQERLEKELQAKKNQISDSLQKVQEIKKTFIQSQRSQLKILKKMNVLSQQIQIIAQAILGIKNNQNVKKKYEQQLKRKQQQFNQLCLKAEQLYKERKLKAEQQQKEQNARKLKGKIKQEQIKISKLKQSLYRQKRQKQFKKEINKFQAIQYEKQLRKIIVQQNITKIQQLIYNNQIIMNQKDKQIQSKYEKQAESVLEEISECEKKKKNYQQQLKEISQKKDKRQTLPNIAHKNSVEFNNQKGDKRQKLPNIAHKNSVGFKNQKEDKRQTLPNIVDNNNVGLKIISVSLNKYKYKQRKERGKEK